MRLKPFASEQDVDEALRLFQVSTLDAAMSGNLAGESALHLRINSFIPQFLKWIRPSLNLDMSTAFNRVFSVKSRIERQTS